MFADESVSFAFPWPAFIIAKAPDRDTAAVAVMPRIIASQLGPRRFELRLAIDTVGVFVGALKGEV